LHRAYRENEVGRQNPGDDQPIPANDNRSPYRMRITIEPLTPERLTQQYSQDSRRHRSNEVLCRKTAYGRINLQHMEKSFVHRGYR
jgi:hypothetical protein